MYLVAGLGNPGKKYRLTRHNIGFMVIDRFALSRGIVVSRSRGQSIWGRGDVGNVDTILLKPQTYVNNSGQSVVALLNYFKIDPSMLIVIHDDINLPFGKLRIRDRGRSGGHRGMESILSCVGRESFVRIRVGIGKPLYSNMSGYVLGRFSSDEREALESIIERSSLAIEAVILKGVSDAMNEFNY